MQAGLRSEPIFGVALLNTKGAVKVKIEEEEIHTISGRLSLCTLVKVAEQCA